MIRVLLIIRFLLFISSSQSTSTMEQDLINRLPDDITTNCLVRGRLRPPLRPRLRLPPLEERAPLPGLPPPAPPRRHPRPAILCFLTLHRVRIREHREYLPAVQPDAQLMALPPASPDHHHRTGRLLPAFWGRSQHCGCRRGSHGRVQGHP